MSFEEEKKMILEEAKIENLKLYEKYLPYRKKGLDGMPEKFIKEQRELNHSTLKKIEEAKQKYN